MKVREHHVDHIVAISDDVLRNLSITVAYGRMAQEFAGRVAGDLSWCGFGLWASEGVGGAIRHHETERHWFLRTFRRVRPERYAVVADDVARAFAAGNRDVFGHIGRGFAQFHAALDDDDPGAVDRFLARHSSPETSVSTTGPTPKATVDVAFEPPVALADGFAFYLRAMDEPDARRRAQLVAVANLCLAFVEQVRLQGPIDEAFGALLSRRLRHPLARASVSRFLTEFALRLRLGDEELRPGRRLPGMGARRWPGGRRWPDALVRLDADLFDRFRAVTVGSHRRRAPQAGRWTSLRHRLRYIAALMRSRQQTPALFTGHPFSPGQIEAIESGHVPPGLERRVPR